VGKYGEAAAVCENSTTAEDVRASSASDLGVHKTGGGRWHRRNRESVKLAKRPGGTSRAVLEPEEKEVVVVGRGTLQAILPYHTLPYLPWLQESLFL